MTAQPKGKDIGFLNTIGMDATFHSPRDHMNVVQVTQWNDLDAKDTCNISLSTVGELNKSIQLRTAGYYGS